MDKCSKTESELLKDIIILRAIFWINKSWNEVDTTTITKCFYNSSFDFFKSNFLISDEADPDEDDEVPLAALKLAHDIFGINYSELQNLDCKQYSRVLSAK